MPHRRRAAPQIIAEVGSLVVESDPLRPSGRLLRQAGMEASYNDLADPRHLEFDYLRWMRVVLTGAHAHRVLHIGGAGCALARALAAADPDGRQEVYEVDPAVVAIAREHLGLRRTPGLKVRVGDGAAALAGLAGQGGLDGLGGQSATRDAVVIDAFLGAAVAPGPTTPAALAHAAAVAPLTLVNVVDDRGGREVDRIGAALADAYPRVWSAAGRSTNTVLGADRDVVDLAWVRSQLTRDASPAALRSLS